MKAIMLAAGIGKRLYGDASRQHKALLRFAGQSLLERHIKTLRRCAIEHLVLVVGHRAEQVLAEVSRLRADDFVSPIHNPDYLRGSLVSLWCARGAFRDPEGFLYMDADVLYHPALIDRLIASPHADCLLLDRDFESDEEPVKVCVGRGQVIEFRKRIHGVDPELVGEWPGFMKISASTAAELARIMQEFIDSGRIDDPMEEAVRELILRRPERFGWEDVTGLPWIEIDFPADVDRAREKILPHIETL
ncbi:MAG: phosphocholine cytidylyltransferase family protein [Gammaproteobacteria bacterium]